jgi:hypothetical protein
MHFDIDDDWSGPPVRCDDCDGYVNRSHSEQGFGHYRRCCACYERRQRGLQPVRPLPKARVV